MIRPLQKSHAKFEIEIRNTRRMLDERGDSVWSTSGNAKMNDICMIFDLDEQHFGNMFDDMLRTTRDGSSN